MPSCRFYYINCVCGGRAQPAGINEECILIKMVDGHHRHLDYIVAN